MLGWLNRLRTRTAAPPPASEGPTPAVPDATVATPEPVAPPPSVDIPHDKIVARAYEIWVRKGKPHDQDFKNWTEAEAELRAEFAAQTAHEPPPRKSR